MAATLASAAARQPATPQPLAIEKVRDNLFVITGGGGNVAAFIATEGVVLVDSKLANYGQQILDRVRSVTDKPVTHIINTHTHGDHVGSNAFFPASVEIVAHANTAANMAKMKPFQDEAGARGLPDRTFTDRLTLLSGRDTIELRYFGRAHTDGDAFVVFRSLGVMHAGDVFPGPSVPFMDGSNGGSGLQYPETLAKAAAGITGIETVIPGHSAVTSWQAFVDYGEFVRAFVASVQESAKAGRTPDEALEAFTPPEKFKHFSMNRAKGNIDLIYQEVRR
jgi:glyoxylase-like metal-dependent hydrolase (beta-lactamase superfamily II)